MRFHYSSTFLTFWHLKAGFQIRTFVKVTSLRTYLVTEVSTTHVENIAMDLINSLCECIRRSTFDILFREFVEIATRVNHFTMKVVDVLSHQHALEFVRVRHCKLLKIMHSLMSLIRLCRAH
jgi:hypothetical protein